MCVVSATHYNTQSNRSSGGYTCLSSPNDYNYTFELTQGEIVSLVQNGVLYTYGKRGTDMRVRDCFEGCLGNCYTGNIINSVFEVVSRETLYQEGITSPHIVPKLSVKCGTFGVEHARWGFTTQHIVYSKPTPVYEANDDNTE